MADAAAVAQALVDYDAGLAEQVLRLIATELGAPTDGDVQRIQSALTHVTFGEPSRKSTVEWKLDFAHIERLRSLGVEIGKLL